ncbi:carboxypeptidase M32 [Reinekea sp.]|jgi:carboxypeptidase Taq|uniref:carboxypeptidase M32 n=1 Tax=Reinekea sp. TaxID=1970455 RepID=UPI002A818CCB|nr:carboxypeptidase M32 [Reinekea sp.]
MSYQLLSKTFYRLAQLDHANAMLSWDQQVMMPPKSNKARGRAMAELSVLGAEILQAPDLADAFAAASDRQDLLADWQRANLREMRLDWQRACAIPKDLVAAEAMATNDCEHAWRQMRRDNNWHDFEPLLQTVFDLAKEKAQALRGALQDERGYSNDYDALLDIFDPGTRMSRIDPVFAELKTELPGLLQQITDRQNSQPALIRQAQPVAKARQIELARELMRILGFDFSAGRLDEAGHPFSGGVSEDSRITTRYDENNVIEGLMGIIHETGHARYEAGLPEAWRHQPVGRSMGMGVHESQSLFFEMQLGRCKAFIDAIAPKIAQHLGQEPAFGADNMLRLYTHVEPGLIRVNADEVTYPLHVLLRYELERDLILGTARVQDIPARWNQAMYGYLGLNTEGNYRDGPMQDIHWPSGAIGYFPSYTLGAMNAAQLHAALQVDIPNAPALIGALDLEPIFSWLSSKVWQQGRSLGYDELMIQATGETLNSAHFLAHIRGRYL